MLTHFSIVVLIVSGIVSENKASPKPTASIDNGNHTLKVQEQSVLKSPKFIPVASRTRKSDQKYFGTSKLEDEKLQNWNKTQNASLPETVENTTNKTTKVKFMKVKKLEIHKNLNQSSSSNSTDMESSRTDVESLRRSKTVLKFQRKPKGNFTDQEGVESSVHLSFAPPDQVEKPLDVQNSKRFGKRRGVAYRTSTSWSFSEHKPTEPSAYVKFAVPDKKRTRKPFIFKSSDRYGKWKEINSNKANKAIDIRSNITGNFTDHELEESSVQIDGLDEQKNQSQIPMNTSFSASEKENVNTTSLAGRSSNLTDQEAFGSSQRIIMRPLNKKRFETTKNTSLEIETHKMNVDKVGVALKSQTDTGGSMNDQEAFGTSLHIEVGVLPKNISFTVPKLSDRISGNSLKPQTNITSSFTTQKPSESETLNTTIKSTEIPDTVNSISKKATFVDINASNNQSILINNYTDQETLGSSLHIEIGDVNKNRKSFEFLDLPNSKSKNVFFVSTANRTSNDQNLLKHNVTDQEAFGSSLHIEIGALNKDNKPFEFLDPSNPKLKQQIFLSVANKTSNNQNVTISNFTDQEALRSPPQVETEPLQNNIIPVESFSSSIIERKISLDEANKTTLNQNSSSYFPDPEPFRPSLYFGNETIPKSKDQLEIQHVNATENYANVTVVNQNSTKSNLTDQEPLESSLHLEIGTLVKAPVWLQNRNNTDNIVDSFRNERSRKFQIPEEIIVGNFSKKYDFKDLHHNASTPLTISPSQPVIRPNNTGKFFVSPSSFHSFNTWIGMDAFPKEASETIRPQNNIKVDDFQNNSQTMNKKEPVVLLLLNKTLQFQDSETESSRLLKTTKKYLENEANFKVVPFDKVISKPNQTLKNQTEDVVEVWSVPQSPNLQLFSNNTVRGSIGQKDYGALVEPSQFKIKYLEENRKLLQNNSRYRNYNQYNFDNADYWRTVALLNANLHTKVRDQKTDPSNTRYAFHEFKNPPIRHYALPFYSNETLHEGSKRKPSEYLSSESTKNFKIQVLGDNEGGFDSSYFDGVQFDGSHFEGTPFEEGHFDGYEFEPIIDNNSNKEVQILRPSITEDYGNGNVESQVTEKFIPNNNWNYQEEWKAISGAPQPHTETEIKIEKNIPQPYPVVKNVLYPVEKHVPVPVKVEVPSPYPVVKEVHVPEKVPVTVPVPIYKPVPVEKVVKYPVRVPVDQPYSVPVKVPQYYPVEVQIPFPVKVKVPKPIPVIKEVPYEVKEYVRVPKPYPVHKNVYYPVKIRYERLVPYSVYKPYPVRVIKNVYVPYYVNKPFPVKVYEEKGIPIARDPKIHFFKTKRPQHPPHHFEGVHFPQPKHPQAIPVYEEPQEKAPSEFESQDNNSWKVNYDPYGQFNP